MKFLAEIARLKPKEKKVNFQFNKLSYISCTVKFPKEIYIKLKMIEDMEGVTYGEALLGLLQPSIEDYEAQKGQLDTENFRDHRLTHIIDGEQHFVRERQCKACKKKMEEDFVTSVDDLGKYEFYHVDCYSDL
jgi:hypothetical protein